MAYLPLSTANLPEPTISPADDASPEDYFNTVLWTGDGSTPTRDISDVGFQPDFVWAKRRSNTGGHYFWDAVRGTNLNLFSNSTIAELNINTGDPNGGVSTSTPNGFTIIEGTTNINALNTLDQTHVAWNWKANGSGVSNTDGSITSTVSANTESGFSIVSYTGTGSAATVGHGLDSAPEMIIQKVRDAASQWYVYHSALGGGGGLRLNTTDALISSTTLWNNTAPTSSVFSLGTNGDTNGSGESSIAYCFHSVEGFSKFGSYTGNGSTDGVFIYCGFRPAFVMVKQSNTTRSWLMLDSERNTYNAVDNGLFPNLSNAEGTGFDFDFTSNGFKIRTTNVGANASGGTYIFMAFSDANGPFKYSNAR